MVIISGATLNEVLEASVSRYQTEDPKGLFLQFSGKRIFQDCETLRIVLLISIIQTNLPPGEWRVESNIQIGCKLLGNIV